MPLVASSSARPSALQHQWQICPRTHCCEPERVSSGAELRPRPLPRRHVVWQPTRSSLGLEMSMVSMPYQPLACNCRRVRADAVALGRPLSMSTRGLVSNESASIFRVVPLLVPDVVLVAQVSSPTTFPRAPLLAFPSVSISAFGTGYRSRKECGPHSSSGRPIRPSANL